MGALKKAQKNAFFAEKKAHAILTTVAWCAFTFFSAAWQSSPFTTGVDPGLCAPGLLRVSLYRRLRFDPNLPCFFACPFTSSGFLSEKHSELTISTRLFRTLPPRANDVPDGVYNVKTNTYSVFNTMISGTWRGG
jgi:hypothetical protein